MPETSSGPAEGGPAEGGPAVGPAEGGPAKTPKHQRDSAGWPEKRFTANRAQRAGSAVVAALTRWRLVPHTYVMTTIGRKSGTPRMTPVTLVETTDKKWLVAPYGPVSWVLKPAPRVGSRCAAESRSASIRSVKFPPPRRDRC